MSHKAAESAGPHFWQTMEDCNRLIAVCVNCGKRVDITEMSPLEAYYSGKGECPNVYN